MAVIRREYNIAAYWNSNDLLDTIQTALADVGFHAPTQTGQILTFTNTAGTAIAAERGKRYLVKQSATSGSGNYATFDILRNSTTGAISSVVLVRGGKGYAASNTITIAGADIGGVTPTDNITITVSTVSGALGSASTWFDKDTANPYTWGVCCVNNDETKMLGQTFYSFYIPANPSLSPTLSIKAGAGWQSTTHVFNGVSTIDYINNGPNATNPVHSLVVASSNATQIRLVTFQSSIDPNFVVFQFSDIEQYGVVFRDPFILSKYSTATQPWSLDDCFTGAIYTVAKIPAQNTADSAIYVSTQVGQLPKRSGEWGYSGYNVGVTTRALTGYYESTFGRRVVATATASTYPLIYQRTVHDRIHDSVVYNPVITGLPICNAMLPVPYFMPADFGITEVVGTNTIAQRDIINVGATTQWRVLQYANNLSNVLYNSSIAFVCKVVD